jgi:hypothetical protein
LEDDLARLPEHEGAEQDASLQELPDLIVLKRVALVFTPQDEWAASATRESGTSLPRDHRAYKRAVAESPSSIDVASKRITSPVYRRSHEPTGSGGVLDLAQLRFPLAGQLGALQTSS